MCGITAILNKTSLSTESLRKANRLIRHRGPDDEGFLLLPHEGIATSYFGADTANETRSNFRYNELPATENWKVGLGHRRLSIIDLSPGGHQPMVSEHLSIVFNGEIYNYIEIRNDLRQKGYTFETSSDTEVILKAWDCWGAACMQRFNGMFSFVLLNSRNRKMYAVRDRFGVKPLYYTENDQYLALGSEVKQLTGLPGHSFQLNNQIAYDYLRYGLVDHSPVLMEKGIFQLEPGHLLEISLDTFEVNKIRWYSLVPREWNGSPGEAFEQFYHLLKDSVRLRLRSDVPIGSALSGGLDSSSIACLMREVLDENGNEGHLLKTITSCHELKQYDEWEYAEKVIEKIDAKSFKVFPSFAKLEQDIEKMIWHLDYPFGSTSQFSQWCVFEEAGKQGLTVMLNGQGADEQLAGYGGNDLSLYSGLVRKGNFRVLASEISSYKQRKGSWPFGFVIGAIQANFPATVKAFPRKYRPLEPTAPNWLNHNGFTQRNDAPITLQQHLCNQIQVGPLPSLLRYEDRNSMAFSIESRVPFMDYRLIEFVLGLPEDLVYKNGVRKFILRKALKDTVPDAVLSRTDKMGFVSAEEKWLKEEGGHWFEKQMDSAIQLSESFVNAKTLKDKFHQTQRGKVPFTFETWRVICFGAWLRSRLQVKVHSN